MRVQVWRARAVERRFTVFEKKSPAASEKRETQKERKSFPYVGSRKVAYSCLAFASHTT